MGSFGPIANKLSILVPKIPTVNSEVCRSLAHTSFQPVAVPIRAVMSFGRITPTVGVLLVSMFPGCDSLVCSTFVTPRRPSKVLLEHLSDLIRPMCDLPTTDWG